MSPRIKPETRRMPIVKGRRFRIRPRVWVCLAILVGLGFGAHFLWQRYRADVARDPQYILAAERIQITPPPRGFAPTSRLRFFATPDSSALSPFSTIGIRLPSAVKDAFELHPWVASVERITRRCQARSTSS